MNLSNTDRINGQRSTKPGAITETIRSRSNARPYRYLRRISSIPRHVSDVISDGRQSPSVASVKLPLPPRGGVVGVNEVFSSAIPAGRHMRAEFAAHIVHVGYRADIARVKCFNKHIPGHGSGCNVRGGHSRRHRPPARLINVYCLEFLRGERLLRRYIEL